MELRNAKLNMKVNFRGGPVGNTPNARDMKFNPWSGK